MGKLSDYFFPFLGWGMKALKNSQIEIGNLGEVSTSTLLLGIFSQFLFRILTLMPPLNSFFYM